MIYSLFSGYFLLKNNRMAHRDIKPDNLIIFNEDDMFNI